MIHRTSASLVPGVAVCAVVAAAATALSTAVPLLSPLLVAILAGVAGRNLVPLPAAVEPGLAVTGRVVLRAGVVLLGLRLSVPAVLALGWGGVGVIVTTVCAVFLITLWLGRLLGLSRATSLLTATGTAICGAAAVAGMSAVVRPDDGQDDVDDAAATAVASVTLFGTLAVVVMPLLAAGLDMGSTATGVWVGASVHEVGQVVAAGGLISTAVLQTAVVAKLGRVALLAPLVAVVGVLESRRARRLADGSPGEAQGPGRRRTPVVPLFVVGFLVAVVARSVLEGRVAPGVWDGASAVASFLLTMAMCAMGAGVNVRRLVHQGLRPLALGAVSGVVSAVVSLAGVALLVR